MMNGYNRPLYVLPFDHRSSYIKGLFHWQQPLNAEQIAEVAASKYLIYEGFQKAVADGVPRDRAAILVDEEFGANILRDASSRGYITCMSIEKSGSKEFEFEYGEDFARHLEEFNPTFGKVLVRYNPEGDAGLNKRQGIVCGGSQNISPARSGCLCLSFWGHRRRRSSNALVGRQLTIGSCGPS